MGTYTPTKTYNGRDLMVYVNDNGTYKSIAWATSHSVSVSQSMQTISTKDNAQWGSSEPSEITWEITSDNLYSDEGYSLLFNSMVAGDKLTVKFGLKKAETGTVADGDVEYWQPSTTTGAYYMQGDVIISSLDLTAENGNKCTFSATFTGVSKLELKQVGSN